MGIFTRIGAAWRALTSGAPLYRVVTAPDRSGRWRWHIVDDEGVRKTLMSGFSHADFIDAAREAKRLARARFEFVVEDRHRDVAADE